MIFRVVINGVIIDIGYMGALIDHGVVNAPGGPARRFQMDNVVFIIHQPGVPVPGTFAWRDGVGNMQTEHINNIGLKDEGMSVFVDIY